jgi:hypothetical protein
MRISVQVERVTQADDQDQAGIDQGLQELLGAGSAAVIIRFVSGQ